jgi:hypothetical protein
MTTVVRETPLERAYSRLLMAYPRDYRRLRGAEILGVLVDGARPGQRYPRLREVADVLAGGLRQRLGVHSSTGFADGLRIALPIALALGAALSANVRVGGLDTVPMIQPYAYLWAAALVAWVMSPLAGRVAAVAAGLLTIRLAAAWSYGFHQVFAVCLVGTIAAVAAVIVPRVQSTVEGRDYGSALWRLPGRVATLLAAAALGGMGFVGLTWWNDLAFTVAQFVVVVLAVAGAALAARGRGTGLLWAAGVLAPSAVVLPLNTSLYDFIWDVNRDGGQYPWLLLRHSLQVVGDIVVPMVAATMLATALVAAVIGRAAAQRAASTLTRSTLAGLAIVTGALEVVGGVPSIAVLAGCAALIVTGVASALLPRAIVVVVYAAAAIAVLSDIMSPVRYGRPWPLYVLALLAVLALVQTLLETGKPPLWSTVAGALAMFAVAAAVVYKATHYSGIAVVASYRDYFSNIEHEPLFLAMPALAAGLVIATSLAGRMPARAAATVAVALGGLLWLAAPIRNLAIVAGVAVAAAILAVLVGYFTSRFARAAPARQELAETSAVS